MESRDVALAEAGDLLIPIEEGAIGAGHVVADLAEVARGAEVRRSAEDVTVFEGVGMAFEDLVVAKAVVGRTLLSSIRRGRGARPGAVDPGIAGRDWVCHHRDRAGQKVVGVLMIVAAIGIGAAVAAGGDPPIVLLLIPLAGIGASIEHHVVIRPSPYGVERPDRSPPHRPD